MMLIAKKAAAVLLVLAVFPIAGCGNTFGNGEPTTPEQGLTVEESTGFGDETQPTAEVSDTQTMETVVYYIKNKDNKPYLVREIHLVEKSAQTAKAALEELVLGRPLTKEAFNVFPKGTKILGINIKDGLATVDFSQEVLSANTGAAIEALGIASIVNTMTEFPSVQKVKLTVEGSAEKGMDWWGHIGLYKQPFTRDLSRVMEPAIWLTAPKAGQTVGSPMKVAGMAMVFEATVNYRLKNSEGKILAEGFAQAAAGAPEHGEFSFTIDFAAETGKGTLEVFEVSMKDGGEINKVSVPVVFK